MAALRIALETEQRRGSLRHQHPELGGLRQRLRQLELAGVDAREGRMVVAPSGFAAPATNLNYRE